jgi:hypothetical protein
MLDVRCIRPNAMKHNALKMLGLTLLTSCAGRISSLPVDFRNHVCNNLLAQEMDDDRMGVLRKNELLAMERAGKRAVRVGNSLLVDLDTNSVVELVDCFNDSSDDSCAVYNLIDWNEHINCFIIDVTYWEGGETLLINATTGRRTYTLGIPIISPNKLKFVSIGCNYEPDYAAVSATEVAADQGQ